MKLRIIAIAATVLALLCLLPLAVSAAEADEPVAQIFREGIAGVYGTYDTLEEAVGDLQDGDKLQLLKDITVNTRLVIDKNITFDGGGKTITSSANVKQSSIWISGGGAPVYRNFSLVNTTDLDDGIYITNTIPVLENVTIVGFKNAGITALNTLKDDPNAKMVLKDVTINDCENGSVCISGGANIKLEGMNTFDLGKKAAVKEHGFFYNHPVLTAGDLNKITIDATKIIKSKFVEKGEGNNDDVYAPVYCWTDDQALIKEAVVSVGDQLHLDFFSLNNDTVGDDDTIELLRDVEIDTTIHLVFIRKPFTFNGNNHKITASDDFSRNNPNLMYMLDIDRISDVDLDSKKYNDPNRVMVLKDITFDNRNVAYGLNTWRANVDISNVKVLNSAGSGFAIYHDSHVTAEKLTIDNSDFLGILIRHHASLTGTNVQITNSRCRGIDVYYSDLSLTDSEVEAGNIGILGHGDNAWEIRPTLQNMYKFYLGIGEDNIVRSNKFNVINNNITLKNTKVVGGTAIEVKQTNLDIDGSELIATSAPAVFMNSKPYSRTTFGYAVALTPFNVTNGLYAVGEVTVSDTKLSGLVGIRKPYTNDGTYAFGMDADNEVHNLGNGKTATASIKIDDDCVFDAICPEKYLTNPDRMFVANSDSTTSAAYPYMLAEKVVLNSSVNSEVQQKITTMDTSDKSEEAVQTADAMSRALTNAIEASNKEITVTTGTSTTATASALDGKAEAEALDPTVDKSTVTPRQIVDVAGMASSIANDKDVITDGVKNEAAAQLDVGADAVKIEVQPGIDIKVVDVDENNAITVDIEPVYQLYAYADGKDPLPVSVKQSMAFEGTSVKVSIPLVDGFAEVGETITVEHTKEDGTTHSYEATVVKVGDLLYAEFENPHGFSQFTLKPANSDDEIDKEEEEEEEDDSGFMAFFFLKMLMQRFDFTVISSEGGTVTTDHVGEIRYGQRITYTITPDEGYEIADVLINGESIGVVSEYTFRRYKKDQTIEAIFTRIVDAE